MTNNFEKNIEAAKRVALNSQEKRILRTRIEQFRKEHPFVSEKVSIVQKPIRSPLEWTTFFRSHAIAVAFMIVFFVSGAGTLLAENSLPGSTLYGVKTGVNERVLGWLATSEQSKAEWHLTIADRRFSEIQTLAEENKLTPEQNEVLQKEFDENTKVALGNDDGNTASELPQEAVPMDATMSSMSTTVATETPESEAKTMATFAASPVAEIKKKASTTEVVAPTHVTVDEVKALEEKVLQKKGEFESQKKELKKQNQFVRLKGRALVAEKLLFSAKQALRDGKEEDADKFFREAKVSFSLAATSTTSETLSPEGTSTSKEQEGENTEDSH